MSGSRAGRSRNNEYGTNAAAANSLPLSQTRHEQTPREHVSPRQTPQGRSPRQRRGSWCTPETYTSPHARVRCAQSGYRMAKDRAQHGRGACADVARLHGHRGRDTGTVHAATPPPEVMREMMRPKALPCAARRTQSPVSASAPPLHQHRAFRAVSHADAHTGRSGIGEPAQRVKVDLRLPDIVHKCPPEPRR